MSFLPFVVGSYHSLFYPSLFVLLSCKVIFHSSIERLCHITLKMATNKCIDFDVQSVFIANKMHSRVKATHFDNLIILGTFFKYFLVWLAPFRGLYFLLLFLPWSGSSSFKWSLDSNPHPRTMDQIVSSRRSPLD